MHAMDQVVKAVERKGLLELCVRCPSLCLKVLLNLVNMELSYVLYYVSSKIEIKTQMV